MLRIYSATGPGRVAVSLFRGGAVSAGFAARMACKPLSEMLTLLSSLGIPLTGANAADARDDLNAGKQWAVLEDARE